MNPLPAIPAEIWAAATTLSRWMTMQGYKKWELFDVCSRNHATDLEHAEAKLARLSRLIDLAQKCDDAKSEAELAASAIFMEALALTNADLLEKERDEARAEVERLRIVSGVPPGSPFADEGTAWTYAEWMEVRGRALQERDQWRAAALACDDALRNCMGHLSGKHPHWKAAFKAHGIVEKLGLETGKKS